MGSYGGQNEYIDETKESADVRELQNRYEGGGWECGVRKNFLQPRCLRIMCLQIICSVSITSEEDWSHAGRITRNKSFFLKKRFSGAYLRDTYANVPKKPMVVRKGSYAPKQKK